MPELIANLLSGMLVAYLLADTELDFTKPAHRRSIPARQRLYRICAYRCRNPCLLLSPAALHCPS